MLNSRKNQAQFCASWATLQRRNSDGLSLRISKVLQQELGKREVGSGLARFFSHRLPQQIFGFHAQSRCDDPRWRRLRFSVSSLLSQTGGQRKPGSSEVWRFDHRFSQKVLEFCPLLQRYVAAGGAKVFFQQ